MAPRSLRKTIPSCKTGERLGKDLYLKGTEKGFKMVNFLKQMLKEDGGQGPGVRKKWVSAVRLRGRYGLLG